MVLNVSCWYFYISGYTLSLSCYNCVLLAKFTMKLRNWFQSNGLLYMVFILYKMAAILRKLYFICNIIFVRRICLEGGSQILYVAYSGLTYVFNLFIKVNNIPEDRVLNKNGGLLSTPLLICILLWIDSSIVLICMYVCNIVWCCWR